MMMLFSEPSYSCSPRAGFVNDRPSALGVAGHFPVEPSFPWRVTGNTCGIFGVLEDGGVAAVARPGVVVGNDIP